MACACPAHAPLKCINHLKIISENYMRKSFAEHLEPLTY